MFFTPHTFNKSALIGHPDVAPCTLESLQQSKVYQKEQRRQFKELKELVRRHQKKTAELLREFNSKYKKMARQCSKSRSVLFTAAGFFPSPVSSPVSRLLSPRKASSASDKDERLQQLRDEQQQQLLALRQEQYYSQKYLQREHIKMVNYTRSCSSEWLWRMRPLNWRPAGHLSRSDFSWFRVSVSPAADGAAEQSG